jgi:hypothetical protein
MYSGVISFQIQKSFGILQLVPEQNGLRMAFFSDPDSTADIDILLPLESIGGIWTTAKAFMFGVESLDENIILQDGISQDGGSDILIKLYRDRPLGDGGKLTGDESCWLRIVTGHEEHLRKRIKLNSKDLMTIEIACNAVLAVSSNYQTSVKTPLVSSGNLKAANS